MYLPEDLEDPVSALRYQLFVSLSGYLQCRQPVSEDLYLHSLEHRLNYLHDSQSLETVLDCLNILHLPAGLETGPTKRAKETKVATMMAIIKPVPFNLTIRPTDSFF